MNDAASFDAIMQCNLLEVFCEAIGAAVFVTDKLDQLTFASIRLLHLFQIRESAIEPGNRARDLYSALYESGCRFGTDDKQTSRTRDEWVAERIACAWKERVDKIEQLGPDRYMRIVSRRFSSGLGFVVLQDVSEQKKRENLLRVEQERVKLTEDILDALPVAIAVKDRNLNFVAINREFSALTGLAADDVLGRSIWDVVEPELAGRMEQTDWQLLSSGEPHVGHVEINAADGRTVSLEHRARRIGNPGQNYIAMSLIETVASAGIQAADAYQAGEVMPEMEPSPNADNVSATVLNALYLVPGADPGQALVMALRAHGIDLCVIKDLNEFVAFLPAAKEAGVSIDFVLIDGDFPPAAFNIVARAGLKFRMIPEGSEDAIAMVEILNGLDGVPRRRPAGIEIELENPVEVSQVIDWPGLGSIGPDGADIDVLAIEDNQVNRMALSQILESLELSFMVAGSGEEAIASAKAHTPRIILADVTLPDMDAGALCRALTQLHPHVPLVGLIPSDNVLNRTLCTDAGFEFCLPKPLSTEVLGAVIARYLSDDVKPQQANAMTAA